MKSTTRRDFVAAAGAIGSAAMLPTSLFAQDSKGPIRVGGSLALTGPLSSTGLVHKLVGEIFVEDVNKRGGMLGRQVEWILKDDQSKPDVARTLYEQLITVDKVDLLMGPYATGNILSAMGVAQRYGKTLFHHTFGIPSLAKYDQQFAGWATGPEPEVSVTNMVLDAMAAAGKNPKTIAIVTSKFPSVQFLAVGMRDVAKKRGLQEVLFLEWDFGNREFGPIAGRIKDANPDFIFVGSIGLESNQLLDAMKKIDYAPKLHFHTYPSPGPMLKAAEANGAMSVTIFEDSPPFTDNPVAAAFCKRYTERATKAGLPDTFVEVQAAASYTAWQIMEAGVVNTKSLDDKAIATWLRANKVDTIEGRLRFNERGNYGDSLSKIKQVQDGRWVTVFPAQWAAPGAKLKFSAA